MISIKTMNCICLHLILLLLVVVLLLLLLLLLFVVGVESYLNTLQYGAFSVYIISSNYGSDTLTLAIRAGTEPFDLSGGLAADGVPPHQGKNLGSLVGDHITWAPVPHAVLAGIPYKCRNTYII